MDTPCKSICLLDNTLGLCVGCGRTLAEITAWCGMTDTERRSVMDRLDDRLIMLSTALPAAAPEA